MGVLRREENGRSSVRQRKRCSPLDQWRWAIDRLFEFLDLETIGSCNRTCPTCIRNSHPDRKAVASWFAPNYLEEGLIYEAVEQALAMGFRGRVVLSHYNEPLMDERLPRIVQNIQVHPQLASVHINTNADLLTEEIALGLDGFLDFINVSLYMDDPVRSERSEWIKTLFKKTKVHFKNGAHMPTHFSPAFDLDAMLPIAQEHICSPRRVIINHRRQYLLCCDDMIGNFNLGTFPEVGIEEYWHSRRAEIAQDLSRVGGRRQHSYCMTCPKGAHPVYLEEARRKA